MTADYEIVKYCADFKTDLVGLQQHHWGSDLAVNAAYLEWKYEQNPYLETPCIHVAVLRGEIVGMRGMYGAKWQHGDARQTFVGPCAGDVVIAPAHRKKGLFARMTQAALADLLHRGHPFAFNLSAGRITYFNSLALGWRGIGCLQSVSKCDRATGIVSRARRKARRLTARWRTGPTDVFRALDRFRTSHSLPLSIERKPRPAAMASLVERTRLDGRIRHVQDAQYFAWRYRNPAAQYRFLFWGNTSLEGYLILATPQPQRSHRVCIIDWVGTSQAVLAHLLQAAVQQGNFRYIDIWSATLPEATRQLLKDHQFQSRPPSNSLDRSRPTVLITATDPALRGEDWQLCKRRLLDLENWDVPAASSDAY